MARIRSLKPEAFESETLAKVSVDAERTLFGLTTIVDDRGRLADKPAQINGNLWSMRGGHTAADLDGELEQLVKADGLLCRYTGCDGKRYMHLVTWDRHQKIDHPSKTRIPRCPHHLVSETGRAEECGLHEANCPPRDTLARTREASSGTQAPSPPLASPPGEPEGGSQASGNTTAQPSSSDQPKRESSRETRESSRGLAPDLGPRTVDLGPRTIPPTAGAGKPRAAAHSKPRTPSGNAGDVVAAYVEGALSAQMPRPDETLRKRVGKQAGEMLARGEVTLETLTTAAQHMGAGGWNDLAVQVQRDAAGGSGSSPNGRSSGGTKQTDFTDEDYQRGWK